MVKARTHWLQAIVQWYKFSFIFLTSYTRDDKIHWSGVNSLGQCNFWWIIFAATVFKLNQVPTFTTLPGKKLSGKHTARVNSLSCALPNFTEKWSYALIWVQISLLDNSSVHSFNSKASGTTTYLAIIYFFIMIWLLLNSNLLVTGRVLPCIHQ